jgi:hypothetical protein
VDDKPFDELVARLAQLRSRREAVGGLVAGALASLGVPAIAEAQKKGRKGKGGGKKKKKRGSQAGAEQICGNVPICHCAPPDDPNGNCRINCVSSNAVACNGHSGHSADCVCGGPAITCDPPDDPNIPVCDPSRCNATSETDAQCSIGSVTTTTTTAGPTTTTTAGPTTTTTTAGPTTTTTPAVTCAGECSRRKPCPKVDGVDCVCDFDHSSGMRGGKRTGVCREQRICRGECETDAVCREISRDCVCVFPTDDLTGETLTRTGTCQKQEVCEGICSQSRPCPKVDGANCVCEFDHNSGTRDGKRTGVCREQRICRGECATGTTFDECRRISPDCVCRPTGTPGRGVCSTGGGGGGGGGGGANCNACNNQPCRTGVLNDCQTRVNAACTCRSTGTTAAPGGFDGVCVPGPTCATTTTTRSPGTTTTRPVTPTTPPPTSCPPRQKLCTEAGFVNRCCGLKQKCHRKKDNTFRCRKRHYGNNKPGKKRMMMS